MLKKMIAFTALICMLLTFSSFAAAPETDCSAANEDVVLLSEGLSTYTAEDTGMKNMAAARKGGGGGGNLPCTHTTTTGHMFCYSCGAMTTYTAVRCSYAIHTTSARCDVCGTYR